MSHVTAAAYHGSTSRVTWWGSEPFRDEVTAWVRSATGIATLEPREQPHVRSWSTAIRYAGPGGDVWFKASCPATAFEGSLLALLAEHVPGLAPEVLALDAGRGWCVTADAGPVMRTWAPPEELWDVWERVLPWYAAAQIALAGRTEDLLVAGVPDGRPATIPGLLDRIVEELRVLPRGGLSGDQAARLQALRPQLVEWCETLRGSDVPESVQHDDLHSGNVGWHDGVAGARIFDWGDASVGSPIGTMLCTLNSVAWHAGCEVDDPRVERVRDAFLEPFTAYATRRELLAQVAAARGAGCVLRARSYLEVLRGEPVEASEEHDFPARGWLLELLGE